jgi:hypothetical protein
MLLLRDSGGSGSTGSEPVGGLVQRTLPTSDIKTYGGLYYVDINVDTADWFLVANAYYVLQILLERSTSWFIAGRTASGLGGALLTITDSTYAINANTLVDGSTWDIENRVLTPMIAFHRSL